MGFKFWAGKRMAAAVAGWSASFAMMVGGSELDHTDVERWALWLTLLACIPTFSLVMERIALKKTERYERILRDVIRLSAEELVHARARADQQIARAEHGRRTAERNLRSVQ